MTDFGEHVDLTANLASILRRYPFSVGLFREVIQNSDDGKAAKQIFILDRRTYNGGSLLRPSLANLQGPALLACNDGVFSEEDWDAIRNVSQSSKVADTEKIGKHGLGSRAYYHLTDNPQYLSGGHLAIFDPHRWAFEHGGWRETLENIALQYPDQLEPFCKATGEDIGTHYPGTVVRLALRTASVESRISSAEPSADKIHDLLVDFIQQELHLVLLFLSHLTSIEVREIDALGRVRTLASATAHSQPRELSQHSDPSATFSLVNRQVTVVYDASVRPSPAPSPGDWFILRASFPMDECVRDLSNALSDSSEHVRNELDREKLRPEVALAFPGASLQHRPGRLFTYLPLPLETGFPCHIHGVFSLTDARQNLRNPSETILAGTADALAVAWNKLLFSSIIPRAWLGFLEFVLSGGWNKLPSTSIIRRTWLALLESVASDGSSLDLYQMLPPRQDRNTSGDAKYWTTLLRDIVRLACDRNAKIWPIISSTSSQAPTYTALGDALIASEVNNSEQLRVLAKAGIPILLPPPEVSVVLLEISPAQKLTPGTVRPRLVAAPELSAMSRAECNAIVEFLLGDGRLEELVDVPVIPLVQSGSVALSERKKGRALYILFSHEDAELFGRFEPQAVAVDDLPTAAGSRLVRQGSSCLNVTTLNCAKVDRYIQAAAAKFPYPSPSRDSWSWAQTCEWLSLFWRWIGDSSFHAEILVGIRSLPLLPTTAGQLCTLNETIFSFSPDWDDLSRVVFSRIGIKFLHSSIAPAFLQRCRPTIIRSIFEPSDLLDALRPISLVTIRGDGDATKTLQEHLSSILHMSVCLTNLQKATLRSLPIHPVLTNQPSLNSLASHLSSIPPKPCKLYCLKSLNSFPLPIIHDAIFAHVTDVERRLLEQIDYNAVTYPLSEQDLLQLHVEHIVKQPPAMHLRVLEHLARNPPPRSSAILDKLRISPIVRVRGGQYIAPQDVVDPESSISDIIPPEDPSAIFDDKGENARIADALATLGLLRREIDPVYLRQRITSFRDKSSLDAARRLLRTLDSTFYNSGVQGIDGFAWLPTKAGLRTSRETRDASQRMLCDRVWELLDIPEPLRSPPLRRMLGWHEPIPIDVLVEQFRALLPEPRSGEIHPYLLELTTEFGRRYHEMSPSQLDQLFDLLHAQEWVPTSDGRLRQPAFAVFESSSTLRGFGQIPLDFAARPGVKEFLGHMGCATRPTNDAILVQLEALRHERRPEDVVHESLALLGVLDPAVLSEQHRARVLVPGVDGILRTTGELFHNDLGSRMHELRLPPSRVRVHQQIHRPLCTALGIPSLGSLHLEPLELDSEDMREDLTTRIRNVLRAYHVEQAFNEYLANAADAGASRFSIMLDSDEEQKRQASPGTVLCESMATLCCRPALVVHNNAEFTMDDFRGICRIGRGGKQDRDATIGRFGLGALSFYHFTEVAMILSGSHLLLLDPSGRFLPEEVKTNCYILPLDNVRSIYPGHLQVFDDLFGFRVAHNHYKGTIIRLPLRTRLEAMNSASLSNRSFTSDDIHAMLVRYKSDASRSLFFICISEVAALRSGRPAPLWSTCAHRQSMPLAEGEPYNVQRLDIAEVDELGHCRRSEWVVVSSPVAPDCYDRWKSVIARNQVKNVSVAVAGELVQGPDSRTPQSHLFASLPLPIKTALPVHVHASFILADDRRNIRWDGDGTMTDDSRFNRWLVTAILSPLYIFAMERWTSDFPSAVVPWPGTSDIAPDPVSRAFIDTFYGDPEDGLIGTSRQLLRSMTNDRICPSHAVFRGGEPKAIKKLLVRLRPTDLIELPRPVRAELFRLSPSLARRVDPLFVSRVLADKRDEFTSAYRSGTLTVEDIEHCVKYLMGGDTASSHDRLVGRPLLPLAVEGSLADVQRADGSLVVFAGRWTVRPWPLFPAHRFLHPHFDQELLLRGGVNVVPLHGSALTNLIEEVIPRVPRLNATAIQAKRAIDFWHFWDTLSAEHHDPDCVKDFPLIPTADEETFLSLDHALTLPALGAPTRSLSTIASTLRKLGAVILRDPRIPDRMSAGLPTRIRERLRAVDFTFGRVMEFFTRLEEGYDLAQKFSNCLSTDEQAQLAEWIKRSLRESPSTRKEADRASFDIARRLPIWTAHRKGTTGLPDLRSLTDPLVKILPSAITLRDPRVVLFLGKSSDTFFVQYSTEISRLSNAKPMSTQEFAAQLNFPTQLPTSRFATYQVLLDDLLALSRHNGPFDGLKIPNEDRDLVDPHTMYKSSVAEFRAAFFHRPQNFIHTRFRQVEDRLAPFGLRQELSGENFLACVQAIDQDFADRESPEDRERCDVIFGWYSSRLPVAVGSDNAWWRRLDPYAFIPRHASRRSGGHAAFRDTEYALTFPRLVPPSKVLREEYSGVAWTQRALFASAPDKRLYMVDEVVGVPTVEEVVKHLCVLTLRIAPKHLSDQGLLADIKATYEFLSEREAEAKPYLRIHRRDRLFLNVNDPSEDPWQFCAAGQMMFNVPDEDDRQGVRAFLYPFRKLLLAAGAEEIKLPKAPILVLSSAQEELSRLRASFDALRVSRTLTDVMFKVSGDESGDELRAHRALLATTSEYFRDLFGNHFSEGGLASAQQPIVIPLRDALELRSTRLILDHIYTGQFDDPHERDCLLDLLQLAHRWGLGEVLRRAEVLLVNTITPATFLELKDHAQDVGATTLLEKVEEFARENAFVLDEILDTDDAQDS